MIFINMVLLSIVSSNKLISCIVFNSDNKGANNYGLFNLSTKSELIEYENLLPAIDCLDDFVTSYLTQQTTRITVVIDKDIKMSHIYLKELQKSRSTFIITDDYDVENENHRTTLNIFILLNNHNDVEKLNIEINKIGGLGCTYTVLLIDHFENKKLFIEESIILTQLLWIKKIANIVIIGFVNNYYLAMKSNEFKPNILREPMDPVIVGKCQNKKWITNSTLFGPMKMNNCSVNVGYMETQPYIHAVEKNNSYEYRGIDISTLRAIADHLNFTINLSEMEGNRNIPRAKRIATAITSNRSYDILIGGITWHPNDDIDYTVAYEIVQFVFLVPVVQTKSISFEGLVSPLEPSVWVAIIIVLLFAIIIRYTLFYKISFLEIFAIIIGVAWNRQPMGFYYRTMFMSWIIFGFIITQFYLASLPGRLLADPEEDINTISDLIDSKIPIGGTKNVKKYFIGNKTFNDNSTSHQLLHKVFENFIAFERDEYERKLYELITGQNNTIALLASTNTSTINTILDPRNVRVLPEALTSFPLSFAVWHGLPYLNDIDDCLQRLIKCGVIAHYGHIESNTYPNDEIDEIYIKLTDLLPGFFVLGIGCAISSIVLYFEIIIFRSKRNHK